MVSGSLFELCGGLRAVFGRWRELYLRYSFDDLGLGRPGNGFVDGSFLRLRQLTGDVGEGAGTASGDAVGGEGFKELAENVVDVDLGGEIAAGACEVLGEIVLALRGFVVEETGVGEAEAVVFGMSRETAEAAVGEFEFAEVEDIGWSGVGHEGSVARINQSVKLL